MKKIPFLMAMAIMVLGFTACTDNVDNPTTNPTDPKALVGTWISDLSGKTFSIWNYGKAWNVWTFNADGTGVCDTYFLAGDEPVAVQHLDHYSLSVSLYHQDDYNYDFIGNGAKIKSNIGEGYEQCTFHKLTGWGNFLRINTGLPWGNPTCGGGSKLFAFFYGENDE